jgi:hypothetical protein
MGCIDPPGSAPQKVRIAPPIPMGVLYQYDAGGDAWHDLKTWHDFRRVEDLRPGDSVVGLGLVERVKNGEPYEVWFTYDSAFASAAFTATGSRVLADLDLRLSYDPGTILPVLREKDTEERPSAAAPVYNARMLASRARESIELAGQGHSDPRTLMTAVVVLTHALDELADAIEAK